MSLPERAVLGAEILDGSAKLQDLTAKSVAALVGVSVASLGAAARATPEERERIKSGERPLIRPQPALPAPPVTDWHTIDDTALTDMVRAIGIDRTLDAAVAVEHAITD
jgi:hypothetical protein